MAPLLPRFRPDDSDARVQKATRAVEPASADVGPAGGDWRQLRGLPCYAHGVGGAMFGTRPEREILKLDRRRF